MRKTRQHKNQHMEVARLAAGLTREQVAEGAGISEGYYRFLVYGSKIASEAVAKKLALVLRIPVEHIPHKKIITP